MQISSQSKVIILSHFTYKTLEKGAGAPHNIRNYLLSKVKEILYIEQPFPKSNFPHSDLTIYKEGKKVNHKESLKVPEFPLILFLCQYFQNILFVLSQLKRYDFCFALDNLSLLSMLPLKRLGIIKYLVYYTIDYTPKRYSNPYFNKLFHLADRLASQLSDINWVTAKNIISAKSTNGINITECAPYAVVPIGFDSSQVKLLPESRVDLYKLIFVGVLYEKQGLQLVINALPQLIKKYPKLKLQIIGNGDYKQALVNLVKKLKLQKNVQFSGFITDHQEIINTLVHSGIGLATYDPALADFTYFADPSKIKMYLMSGLPVITTKAPEISKLIKKNDAGKVVDYTEQDFVKAVDELIHDRNEYFKIRNQALRIAEEFDIKLILDKAFKNLGGLNE